jgi:putative DNA methylase
MEHGIPPIPLAIIAEGTRGRAYLSGDTMSLPDVCKPDVPFLEQPMTNDRRWFSPPLYGMPNFADLFTARQLATLTTLSDLVTEAREMVCKDASESRSPDDQRPLTDGGAGITAYADSVATYLAFAVDKVAEGSTTLCTWSPLPTKLHVVGTFGRQALPMVWDYTEANVFAASSGNFERMVGLTCEVLERLFVGGVAPGIVNQVDATSSLTVEREVVISTDPPYYDNIGYADLSDFAYVWLRRSLNKVFPSLFATLLTPKKQELIAVPYRHEGDKEAAKSFFERGLVQAFSHMRASHSLDVPLTVFYAFKQSETDDSDDDADVGEGESVSIASTGWETMLEGVLRAGFIIDGTWPVRTERSGGFRNLNQNALASSVVLVCRPRPDNASLATRKEFITALRRELPEALRNLQRGNIAPVDLAQAAIGPGMAVFTRYAKVLESDGSPMTVRTALGLINQSLDEVLAEQEGEFDGDTRWALAWFEQFGMDDGPFGDAETLSKAKNTAINGLQEAGVIVAKAGKVRLVKRDELPDDWNPATDKRLTVWEVTQHLIHRLDQKGETGAAELVSQLGGLAEISRDLAYRLYSTCERKKWAQDALAYNSLVVAWPELTKLARATQPRPTSTQQELFN